VEEYSLGGKPGYFVTLKDLPFCAHGSTLAEAITDATWKDKSKRPSLEELKAEIQKAGKDRLISLSEFKLLTGACSEGCRIALKGVRLDGSPMTAFDVRKHFPEWGDKLLEVLEWQR
jgi:hypothetical protein